MTWKKILLGNIEYVNVSKDGKRRIKLTQEGGLLGCLGSLAVLFLFIKLALWLYSLVF